MHSLTKLGASLLLVLSAVAMPAIARDGNRGHDRDDRGYSDRAIAIAVTTIAAATTIAEMIAVTIDAGMIAAGTTTVAVAATAMPTATTSVTTTRRRAGTGRAIAPAITTRRRRAGCVAVASTVPVTARPTW